MKRVFGTVEVIFDISYLITASILGFILLLSSFSNHARFLSSIMALILVGGDAFHLIPRIMLIRTGKEIELRKKLGRGKQITSISMTLFYLILWHIGVLIFSSNNMVIYSYTIYILAIIRIVLCFMPQNKWEERYPPLFWGIIRNIPFLIQGMLVAYFYFINRGIKAEFSLMWFAIIISFAFYIPVVLFSNKNPKIGMLMLFKTCSYLWMLVICMSL